MTARTTSGTLTNWAGNVDYSAEGLVMVDSIVELTDLLSTGDPVRALGTRHSFNQLADTPGNLVSITAVAPDPELTGDILTIGAGTRYAVAARYLNEHGRALPNMGSLPHISIGGAVSTGTHGSGVGNQSLAAAITAVEIAGAKGRTITLSEGDPDFPGAVVSLGRLGVITRASIRTLPAYLIRQDVYTDLEWEVLFADPVSVVSAGFSVSVFTTWAAPTVEQVWVKRRMDNADDAVPGELFGARLDDDVTARIISEGGDNTTPFGVTLPWLEVLPHFRVDRTPSSGDEIQSEYFIDLNDAGAALRAVRDIADRFDGLLIMSELRTVAADQMWLSPAYQRDSLAIHFTWRNKPEQVLAAAEAIEHVLEPFSPRPHWGKVYHMGPETIRDRYPQMTQMQHLVHKHDPDGQFRGPFVDSLLGLR